MRSLKNKFPKLFNIDPMDRKYRIGGEIGFKFRFVFEPEEGHVEKHVADLQALIREVDSEFPWEDIGPPLDPQKLESISLLGGGVIQRHNLRNPQHWLWFRVLPGRTDVAKGQIHAYENYLAKLASELAKRTLPDGIFSVVSECRVLSSRIFEVTSSN